MAISAPASRQLQRCGRIKASRLQSVACFELCEPQWVIVIRAVVGAVVCFMCCVQMCVAGSCYVVSGGVVLLAAAILQCQVPLAGFASLCTLFCSRAAPWCGRAGTVLSRCGRWSGRRALNSECQTRVVLTVCLVKQSGLLQRAIARFKLMSR